MIVILSGEGPTDLGKCNNQQGECSSSDFTPGPMSLLLDKLIEENLNYSLLDCDSYYFYSEKHLKNYPVTFRGKSKGQGTGLHYTMARKLAILARELEAKTNDVAVAILFRDADGTHGSPASEWQEKFDSMASGFEAAKLGGDDGVRGVPMLPNPKSEAWLLCIHQQYQHCHKLEGLPGNDDSPNSAKERLKEALQGKKSAEEQAEWLRGMDIQSDKLCQMPSFKAFYGRLTAALGSAQQHSAT